MLREIHAPTQARYESLTCGVMVIFVSNHRAYEGLDDLMASKAILPQALDP